MRKCIVALVLTLLLMFSVFIPQCALAQVSVDDNVSNYAYPIQNHSFIYEEHLFQFYRDADARTIRWKVSNDYGLTWGNESTVPSHYEVDNFSVYSRGNGRIDLASCYSLNPTYRTEYQHGVISGESISWSAFANTQTTGGLVTIVADSNGYPWMVIGMGVIWGIERVDIYKSSTQYSWTNAAGYPKYLEPLQNAGWGSGKILPLTNGRMAAVFSDGHASGGYIKIRLYDGVAWGSDYTLTGYTAYYYLDAVWQEDDIHVAFLEYSTSDIVYAHFDYSGASWDIYGDLVTATTTSSAPCIGRDPETNNLHVFFGDFPTDDDIDYVRYVAAEDTWYEAILLNDNDGVTPTQIDCFSVGNTTENFGVSWKATASTLRYKMLGEQFHVDTLEPSGVTETQATLRGELISIGWGICYERGFYIDTTPSLGNITGTLQKWSEFDEEGWGVGVYDHTIGNLTEGERYYYIAFVVNTETSYGEWVDFYAGGTAGFAFITLDPDPIGDFEATFNGEIAGVVGYATWRGFDWGYTADPTWEWHEHGNYTVGFYSYEASLNPDDIYYVRAKGGNDTVTDYGVWIAFMTEQAHAPTPAPTSLPIPTPQPQPTNAFVPSDCGGGLTGKGFWNSLFSVANLPCQFGWYLLVSLAIVGANLLVFAGTKTTIAVAALSCVLIFYFVAVGVLVWWVFGFALVVNLAGIVLERQYGL